MPTAVMMASPQTSAPLSVRLVLKGFYVQCGFSGTGFKIAPAVGACVAELIVDGAAKTVDITPFDPQRFERGDLLKGEHAYEDIWR